jgi:type I restriction enzyme S subunit
VCSLGRIPAVELGQIAEVVGGVTKDKKKESAEGNVDVPYLRVANVQRGYLDLESVTTIRVTPKTLADRALQVGDLLLNEGGDRDKLGRGWVWEGQIPNCVHQNHVHRARIEDQDAYLPKFVSMWANTFGPDWFFDNGGQTNGIASISISKVRQFPVPSVPVARQQEIVTASEALRGVEDNLAVELAALRVVRADLLTALLSQEITVDAAVDKFVKVA